MNLIPTIGYSLSDLWTTKRPFLCSFGDSINEQDVPADLTAGHLGIAPTLWINALCCAAFDYMRFDELLRPSGGEQAGDMQIFRNGMWGQSGALMLQAMKYTIDEYLEKIQLYAGSRPFVVLLSGGINDIANNDTAGYDLPVWKEYGVIVKKIQDAGGFPIMKCGEFSVNINTRKKRRNQEALADRVMSWASGRKDVAAYNFADAWREYGQGRTWERLTRGDPGDGVHPNLGGAILHGLGARDALKGRVLFVPPWNRDDFEDEIINDDICDLVGTTGTDGTNATGSETPGGWTSNSYGTNTAVLVTEEAQGMKLIQTCTGTPTLDACGLAQNAPSSGTDLLTTYRGFIETYVEEATYIAQLGFRMGGDSTVWGVATVGSSDRRDTAEETFMNLIEGEKLVFSSMPFRFASSADGSLYDVGGGGSTAVHASSRLTTFTTFAGLLTQNGL